jgi:hypothetical protein
VYLVFGKEVGNAGTCHLQGFISYRNPRRVSSVHHFFSGRAHVEIARSPSASALYCKKDGDFTEFGVAPTESRKAQGARTDIQSLVSAIQSGETDREELRKKFPAVCAKYPSFVTSVVLDNLPKPVIPDHLLRPWQISLLEILKGPTNDRDIIFVVDETGNAGKSWLVSYHGKVYGTSLRLLPGKKSDMVYSFLNSIKANTRVVFIDAPRSKQGEYIQYDFLEELKNGVVFSTKYESRCFSFKVPHVVVMMNELPDERKLSSDRYVIIKI